MINKPPLKKANIVKPIDYDAIPGLSEAVKQALKAGLGSRELNSSEFGVNSKFTLLQYQYAYNADGYKCKGTKDWISLYKLSSGVHNLSEDYDIIHPSKILLLPSNHAQAIEMIENNYIGKTLRVIARSADESNPYGGRYYLYAIE